jgi:hypothetical protein
MSEMALQTISKTSKEPETERNSKDTSSTEAETILTIALMAPERIIE